MQKKELQQSQTVLGLLDLDGKGVTIVTILRNFETIYKSVQPNIPGDFNLQQHCCKKPISRSLLILHRKVIVVGHKDANKS